ncbi:protein JASON-like isoform X2 [Phragmites australis]|uniref:protein JASON-like isoform X2 n=1 Tax=Phragmites australis TaxID=29695 RepID=UPI002D79C0CE|nr:protein JASON-like isoform X2 [Phragmites australis]
MCRCAAAIARAVVAFLDAVLVACFLSCFRTRPRPGSGSGSSRRDALVHRDRVGEVLWDDEQGRSGRFCEDLADGGGIDEKELRREANYLKLCGTISEIPTELRNESHEINLEDTNEFNMPTNATATNCISLFEANSSEGCRCEEHHTMRPDLNIENTHSSFLEKSPFQNINHKLFERSGSPFPTPLVLKDDVETPGTIYTSHRGASMSGKRVRTRKQFIYPVLRPIENKLQQMELTEDSSPLASFNPPKKRNLGADSIKKPQQSSSTSVAKPGLSKSPSFSSPDINASCQVKETLSLEESKCQIGSVELLDGGELSKFNSDEKHAALSLSHWLKSSFTDVGNQCAVKCAAGDQSYDECSLLAERPAFIASDLNWDVENPTPMLPKTWDGNGIPNTTARYKEDQVVSWHATPFEERLLKVLSDEERCPPRKVVRGQMFHHEEKAE